MYILVPIAVICIGLPSNMLDFHQFAVRLQSVNDAHKNLLHLVRWWNNLEKNEQWKQYVLEHLVDVTELAVHADVLGTNRIPREPQKADKKGSFAKEFGTVRSVRSV